MLPPGSESFGDGCHHPGVFRYGPGSFRFEEQREETGCGEVRITFDLPPNVNEVSIAFTTNREIQYSSQEEALQLPPDNPQRLRVYSASGNLFQEFTVYQDRSPHAPADIEFTAVIPTAQLGNNVTFGWYFEDTGSGLAPLVGAQTGRQFIARVQDVRVTLRDMPAAMTPPATIGSVVDGDITIDTVETVVSVPPAAAGPDAWLKVRHLEAVQAQRILGPDNEPVADIERIATGTQHVILLPVASAGNYTLLFSGSTPVPVVPPVPPTQLVWLAYLAIGITGLVYVAAVAHQGMFVRDAAKHQEFTVKRKTLEIIAIGLGLGALSGYILAREVDVMTIFPIVGRGLGFYSLLGILLVASGIHLGIGMVRRRYARDLREAERMEEANRTLERSNRDLEQFAYVASHDLQEPLRKVASFTSLLERRYGDTLDAKGQGYIHNANEAAVRARHLIRDLLAFSRIGHDAPMEPVDLDALMAEVRSEVQDDLDAAGGTLTVEAMPVVHGSSALLRQLLLNLVGNAIKYRHPQRAPVVTVRARRMVKHWRISVQDNGLGIAKEHHDQVFQIFQRLHGRGSSYEGSGIGLAICQRIVEHHGGHIGLSSQAGKGSEFYVELPMSGGA